jgi:hypothetical protein
MPLFGLLLVAIGVTACYWTFTDIQASAIESDLLDMNLARYHRVDGESGSMVAPVDMAETREATQYLTTPWSVLLNDLELAAADFGKDVALLEIAPDRVKQNIRVSGEARTLNHVLDYVSRLQNAESMSFPLLENHEIQTASRERPVRFVIVADWRTSL